MLTCVGMTGLFQIQRSSTMFDPKDFEALSKKLFDALPSSLQDLEKDIQQQFQDILKATFNKMELVTRDEFDVQVKVLLRTREKVEALQKQLDEMSKSKTKSKPSK
jgi:ubiquinone biosynthesis accessory factor UbiK